MLELRKHQTLETNTSGVGNVAVGSNALGLATVAGYNVAVGANALDAAATTGATKRSCWICCSWSFYNRLLQYFCYVGYSAGASLTTGNDNVLIGYNAGQYQNSVTTGVANTVVGAYARTSSATVTYEVVLGRYGLGQGTNTASLSTDGSGVHIALSGMQYMVNSSDERIKKDITNSDSRS